MRDLLTFDKLPFNYEKDPQPLGKKKKIRLLQSLYRALAETETESLK